MQRVAFRRELKSIGRWDLAEVRVLMVTAAVWLDPLRLMLAVSREQAAFGAAVSPLQERITVPVKPLSGVRVRV